MFERQIDLAIELGKNSVLRTFAFRLFPFPFHSQAMRCDAMRCAGSFHPSMAGEHSALGVVACWAYPCLLA